MIDGGYAEVMIIEARTTVTIPDGLESVKAAPLLCAGVTTYNALRNAWLACRCPRRDPRSWRTWTPRDSVRKADGIQDYRHWSWSGVGEARKRTRRASVHRQRSG